MESYQDVKREGRLFLFDSSYLHLKSVAENMRRMFYKWLAGARNARHRRLYLQQKEDEMKMTVIAAAWDKWRERFLDIRLQPMVSSCMRISKLSVVLIINRRRIISCCRTSKTSCSARSVSGMRRPGYVPL